MPERPKGGDGDKRGEKGYDPPSPPPAPRPQSEKPGSKTESEKR